MAMPQPEREQLVDPVCGERMNPEEAPAVTTYKGESVWFCSDTHKQEFEKNPEKYVHKLHCDETGEP